MVRVGASNATDWITSAAVNEPRRATQRDRLQEMLERNGRLPEPPPPPGQEQAAKAVNFAEIARLEKEEMAEEMAGLGVDEASGMKMFYTGNTLSAERRKEKLRQFKVVRYYIELARHGAESGESGVDLAEQRLAAAQSMLAAASDDLHRAAVAQKRVDDADTALAKAKGDAASLSARRADVAHLITNSGMYNAWLVAVHITAMSLSFWETAYWGQASAAVPHRHGADTAQTWLCVLEACVTAAYFADVAMHRYAQGVSFWGQRRHKLLALLVLVCIVDLVMEWKSSAGKRLSRFARPALVVARHATVRAEARLIRKALRSSKVLHNLLLCVALLATGSILGLVLLRPEYSNTIPGEMALYGAITTSAPMVGNFDNIHRALFTAYSLLTSADNYQFVYIARAYPEAALTRSFAALFTMLLLCVSLLAMATTAAHLYETYNDAAQKVELERRTRERKYLASAFKSLDDKAKGYISIEKLRYFLSVSYPEIPFEPLQARLQRNVTEQAGLVDFFDYLSVMDMVLRFIPPDPLANHSTRLWSTIPLAFVLVNAAITCLFGTVATEADSVLDSLNAFFAFIYAIEYGTKMFALNPARLLKSPVQRVELLLVCIGIVAQVVTIIFVLPAKSLWRMCAALPLLRVFTLSIRLRCAVCDLARALGRCTPALALLVVVNYFTAIVGMQCFSGVVLPSGLPGYPLSFDDFASALVVLVQVSLGGCSNLLLAGKQSNGVDWSWAVSWYLMAYRAASVAVLASLFLRAVSSKAADERQTRLRGGVWSSHAAGTLPTDTLPPGVRDNMLTDTAVALGESKGQLPPMEAHDRQHVETLLAGIHRLGAELKVMDALDLQP